MRHWSGHEGVFTASRTVASKPRRMSSRPVNNVLGERAIVQCSLVSYPCRTRKVWRPTWIGLVHQTLLMKIELLVELLVSFEGIYRP